MIETPTRGIDARRAGLRRGLGVLLVATIAALAACGEEDEGQGQRWRETPATDACDDEPGIDGGSPTNDGAPPSTGHDADAPDPGDPDASVPQAPLKIVVMSDLNGSYGSTTYEASVHQAVAAITTRDKPDVVLVSGDMVAGQQAGLDYAAMWKGFHEAVTDKLVAAGIPVAPSPGNHDASAYAGFQAERAEYERQWKPSRVPPVTMIDGSRFPFRYSFVVGGVFVVALDATTISPLSGEQRTWVKDQLEGAAAYPVRIVFGHVPIHPTTVGRETEVLGDAAFEAILEAHGALFVGGHQHGYYPGVANGVRHVVTPCVGAGPRPLIGTSGASARGYVVIDVADGRVTSIEARTGSDYTGTIARSSLPAEIRSGAHLLERDDLAGF